MIWGNARAEERYVWVRKDLLEALVEGKVRVAGRLKVGRYVLKKRIGRVVPEEGSAGHGHQSEG